MIGQIDSRESVIEDPVITARIPITGQHDKDSSQCSFFRKLLIGILLQLEELTEDQKDSARRMIGETLNNATSNTPVGGFVSIELSLSTGYFHLQISNPDNNGFNPILCPELCSANQEHGRGRILIEEAIQAFHEGHYYATCEFRKEPDLVIGPMIVADIEISDGQNDHH